MASQARTLLNLYGWFLYKKNKEDFTDYKYFILIKLIGAVLYFKNKYF